MTFLSSPSKSIFQGVVHPEDFHLLRPASCQTSRAHIQKFVKWGVALNRPVDESAEFVGKVKAISGKCPRDRRTDAEDGCREEDERFQFISRESAIRSPIRSSDAMRRAETAMTTEFQLFRCTSPGRYLSFFFLHSFPPWQVDEYSLRQG